MADQVMAECGELSLEEIQNMKVTDLRKKLKLLGLPITGNKNELVERLQEACLSNKGSDSFDNSQLSYDESQIGELESTEDNGELEESALLDQDQFSSYITSSLESNPKIYTGENNSSSNTVIMPPKKRTFAKASIGETTEKKVLLNRTNATDIDFDIDEKKIAIKPVTALSITSVKSCPDEKIKLSLKSMSAAERLAMRAKRFNVDSSKVRTTTSIKPLSLNNKNSKQSILSSATTPDLDVLKKRAERFGQCVSTVMKQIEDKEKLLKRKCKFGATLAVSSVTPKDEQAKKKLRAERFGKL